MSDTAIAARGLGKRYRIPTAPLDEREQPTDGRRLSRLWRHDRRSAFWIDAVADVSFDIRAAEAVGLIGRNGAGKSTLLKLLSRVTRPSSGTADTYGRVGALLEVGTGFHPELTGRENAFLSGAILGMSRRDIAARFDEIVAFAEIPQFIDMPVKHYSSGMYARLGFAVAAFLKPEILIVDEILAVGDLSFQAKCLAHMRGLSRDGTTVLFVSHNLLAMADFCPRAMVLADGRLEFDGRTSDAIGLYRRMLAETSAAAAPSAAGRPAHELRLNGAIADGPLACLPHDALKVELEVPPNPGGSVEIELNVVIETPDGRKAIHLRNDLDGTVLTLGPELRTFEIDIEDLSLVPGIYSLWLRLVELRSAPPVIWDTDRIELRVVGDQRWESVTHPRYRFAQH